jgi:hypothetical protein
MPLNSSELRSKDSILALYNSVQNDIAYYRSWEWNITLYYAVLSTGIIGLVTDEKINRLIREWHLWGLTIIQFVALLFSIYHLHRTHYWLAINRQLRNKLERLLGFFDKGEYITNDSVLPQNYNRNSNYYKIGLNEYIFPFMLFLVIYELVTIYIIWTV